eukprot:m.37918 g.37918  ORF g.37918 m.37918 type:complete len:65 (+) comp10142_c0_seq4:5908-6102(+)
MLKVGFEASQWRFIQLCAVMEVQLQCNALEVLMKMGATKRDMRVATKPQQEMDCAETRLPRFEI